MNHFGLLHDHAVLVKFDNISSAIREGDLVNLVRVQPDLSLSTLEHGGCEALLQLEVDCNATKKGRSQGSEINDAMEKVKFNGKPTQRQAPGFLSQDATL